MTCIFHLAQQWRINSPELPLKPIYRRPWPYQAFAFTSIIDEDKMTAEMAIVFPAKLVS